MLGVKVLGKVFVQIFVRSVQIISRLESQSKFQMFTVFSGRHWVPQKMYTAKMAFHTGLRTFAQNIRTNFWKHRDFGEVSFLLISYDMTISWLHPPLNSFRFIFLLRVRSTWSYIIVIIWTEHVSCTGFIHEVHIKWVELYCKYVLLCHPRRGDRSILLRLL